MTISPFSRYADNTVSPVKDRKSVTRSTIIILPPTIPATYAVSTYTWQAGDQIDYLSYSAYGDETQWWRIANANPEILFWDTVASGAQIRVPSA
jgi:nucleoid-associated protein YgaU